MSILGNIFGARKKKEHLYQIPTTTDIHSHLIPGIDDGAQNMEESITLIRTFKEMGYTRIITTPHIMSDFYKNNPSIIRKGLEELKKELTKQNIDIQLEAAAEYYVDENFIKKIENEELLTFGDKYILIESNTINYSDIIRNAIWELNLAGYKPIYAHPERYTYFWKNFDSYHKIKDMGVYFQINLPSLSGYYNPTVQKNAEKLINENMVEFIGSDAHEMRYMHALQKAQMNPIMEKIGNLNILNDKI